MKPGKNPKTEQYRYFKSSLHKFANPAGNGQNQIFSEQLLYFYFLYYQSTITVRYVQYAKYGMYAK